VMFDHEFADSSLLDGLHTKSPVAIGVGRSGDGISPARSKTNPAMVTYSPSGAAKPISSSTRST